MKVITGEEEVPVLQDQESRHVFPERLHHRVDLVDLLLPPIFLGLNTVHRRRSNEWLEEEGACQYLALLHQQRVCLRMLLS